MTVDFTQLANQALATTAPQQASTPIDALGDKIMAGVEIGGTGLLLGYLNARSPGEGKTYHESFGYPTDAIVALGGLLLGFMFGSSHALRIGLGAAIETGVRYGFKQGVTDRQKSLVAGKQPLKAIEGGKSSVSIVEKASSEVFEKAK